MIVHRHADGFEGYEYELGDVVEIADVIAYGEWFRRVIGRTGKVVAFDRREDRRDHWRIGIVDVRYSDDWGPCRCNPWHIKPTAETLASATVLTAAQAGTEK